MIVFQHHLDRFNEALRGYQQVTQKTMRDVVVKQGTKLAYALSRRLKAIQPERGSIRAERVSALRAGRGIKIRPGIRESIYRKYHVAEDIYNRRAKIVRRNRTVGSILKRGRRMNLPALMAEREINLRERGIGYTAYAARVKNIAALGAGLSSTQHKGRYLQILADAELETAPGQSSLTLTWGAESESGEALSTMDAELAIGEALEEVTADINIYVEQLAAAHQARLDAS